MDRFKLTKISITWDLDIINVLEFKTTTKSSCSQVQANLKGINLTGSSFLKSTDLKTPELRYLCQCSKPHCQKLGSCLNIRAMQRQHKVLPRCTGDPISPVFRALLMCSDSPEFSKTHSSHNHFTGYICWHCHHQLTFIQWSILDIIYPAGVEQRFYIFHSLAICSQTPSSQPPGSLDTLS